MGDESLIADIARLIELSCAEASAIRLQPCGGGGNNRVFAFEAQGRPLVAKCYFNHPDDRRDRLGAEYAFVEYARRAGVDCVPTPVACDREHHVAIYERVPGFRPQSPDIDARALRQATDFFRALNNPAHETSARTLPDASEAVFSIADHLALVEGRIARLEFIEAGDESGAAAARFVAGLQDAWGTVRDSILRALARSGESPYSEVMQRCVSPSDFGFHNALADGNGRVRFIDFEYAGWDDPAKMADDFFCQPAVPVPFGDYDRFISSAMSFSRHAGELAARARLLLPVFRIKWCCIMMNDFLPDAARRRRFADPAIDTLERKRNQLAKAQLALASISG